MNKSKLLVIDDAKIFELLKRPDFFDKFPSIKSEVDKAKINETSPISRGCAPCQLKAKQLSINNMTVKKSIAMLPEDEQKNFKDYVNAEAVRLIFRTTSGHTTDVVI